MSFAPATLQLGAGSKIMIGTTELSATSTVQGNELIIGATTLVDNGEADRFEIHRNDILLLSIGDSSPADGDSSLADGDSSPADGDSSLADGDSSPADGY